MPHIFNIVGIRESISVAMDKKRSQSVLIGCSDYVARYFYDSDVVLKLCWFFDRDHSRPGNRKTHI